MPIAFLIADAFMKDIERYIDIIFSSASPGLSKYLLTEHF